MIKVVYTNKAENQHLFVLDHDDKMLTYYSLIPVYGMSEQEAKERLSQLLKEEIMRLIGIENAKHLFTT